jgi:AAA family ATP:ADP antiporter
VIHQWLLILFSSFTASAPYVLICLIGIIGVWMAAVTSLGKRFSILTGSPQTQAAPAVKAQIG